MSIRKHYKMFKKGKSWCYMLLAVVSVALGTTLSSTVHADVTADGNNVQTSQNVSKTNGEQVSAQDKANTQSTTNENSAKTAEISGWQQGTVPCQVDTLNNEN